MAQHTEFAAFLRARREQLTPAEVGLPTAGRRRTPGLRREEVATLAGVSIDYLVRLEQGRDTNPSPGVIASLAHALRLSEEETHYLTKLVARTNGASLCSTARVNAEVRFTVRALLDRLEPTPAFVIGALNDVLAWNDAWTVLAGSMNMLDIEPPNMVRFVFLHPASRRVFPDWSRAADEQAARLRAAQPRWGTNQSFVALLDDLIGIPEFDTRWARHSVAEKRQGVKRLVHPDRGELHIAYEQMMLADDDQRLVTWLPNDEATATAMRTATAAPLRIVGRP
jgi:transcriptional regulator with XRE-family HTH domain